MYSFFGRVFFFILSFVADSANLWKLNFGSCFWYTDATVFSEFSISLRRPVIGLKLVLIGLIGLIAGLNVDPIECEAVVKPFIGLIELEGNVQAVVVVVDASDLDSISFQLFKISNWLRKYIAFNMEAEFKNFSQIILTSSGIHRKYTKAIRVAYHTSTCIKRIGSDFWQIPAVNVSVKSEMVSTEINMHLSWRFELTSLNNLIIQITDKIIFISPLYVPCIGSIWFLSLLIAILNSNWSFFEVRHKLNWIMEEKISLAPPRERPNGSKLWRHKTKQTP